jgi:hypothetical protein
MISASPFSPEGHRGGDCNADGTGRGNTLATTVPVVRGINSIAAPHLTTFN